MLLVLVFSWIFVFLIYLQFYIPKMIHFNLKNFWWKEKTF
jgi:hypothetical protein